MGGHAGGEVAACVALHAVAGPLPEAPSRIEAVRLAFQRAHRRIQEVAAQHPEWREMGTTLTVVWVKGGVALVGHVGDSRAYLVRRGTAVRLTQDHSLVAELVRNGQLTERQARSHPHRHVLTRALGADPLPAVDVVEVALQAGDRLVLCTDGLIAALDEEEIARAVASATCAAQAADALVREATRRQAPDNVTAVVGFVEDGDLEQGAPRGA